MINLQYFITSTIPHCTRFSIYVFPKLFCQSSLQLTSNKYFKNIIIMFCLELRYSVQKSRLELQKWSIKFLISFLEYIFGIFWGDGVLANSFWDLVIQISVRQMNFPFICIFPTMKSFLWKQFFPYYLNLFSSKVTRCMPIGFYCLFDQVWPNPN